MSSCFDTKNFSDIIFYLVFLDSPFLCVPAVFNFFISSTIPLSRLPSLQFRLSFFMEKIYSILPKKFKFTHFGGRSSVGNVHQMLGYYRVLWHFPRHFVVHLSTEGWQLFVMSNVIIVNFHRHKNALLDVNKNLVLVLLQVGSLLSWISIHSWYRNSFLIIDF